MKKLILIALAGLAATFAIYSATITTMPALPDYAGTFTLGNLNQTNANWVIANTNFTNLNTVFGVATGTPTGTGALVLANTPTLITPVLGAATITSLTGLAVDCVTTAACPSTARAMRYVQGIGLLATGSPSTYAVTTISPAFTSSTSFNCYAQDVTTIATNIGVLTAGYVSGSAVTFTGPNTNTDTFRFYCAGY